METGLVLRESGTKETITKLMLTIHTFCVLDDTQCAPHACVPRNGALAASLSKLLQCSFRLVQISSKGKVCLVLS